MTADKIHYLHRELHFYINEAYRHTSIKLIYRSAFRFACCAIGIEYGDALPRVLAKVKAEILAAYLMNELGYRANSSTGEWMKVYDAD